MSASLDGYVNGPDGSFGWSEPDREVSFFVNELQRQVGTYLFGRRTFETMRVWADDAALAGLP
jgi:dihydrofolate reductase